MSTDDQASLDEHGKKAAPTAAPGACERDNRVRYRPGRREGHVESHFIKANAPDGRRALWLRHTLLSPQGRPEQAVAELWAVAFDEAGTRKLALKQTYPIAAARFSDAPFSITLPSAQLTQHHARGELRGERGAISWDLHLGVPLMDHEPASFRPYPLGGMYSGSFPRLKTLTPAPDLRLHGSVLMDGERWNVGGWRGAQGHNWGRGHAEAYAWVHANAWREEGRPSTREGVWVEALSGRVRLGKVVTPWLSVAGIGLEDELLRFDGLAAMCSRRVRVDARSYAFELSHRGATLVGEFRAETSQLAGLVYRDPDGTELSCLNAKIAQGRLRLTRGRRTLHLHTEQAALELGTRARDHGIDLLI